LLAEVNTHQEKSKNSAGFPGGFFGSKFLLTLPD
jgi:hypothetical protein